MTSAIKPNVTRTVVRTEYSEKIRVVKKCPNCGWRILDKVTPTTGVIEMKCPNCRRIVEVDLAFRKIKR